MLVVLNDKASYGGALEKWERVRPALESRAQVEVVPVAGVDETTERLRRAHASGERTFVAAGGDGTVNLLVNAMMTAAGERDGGARAWRDDPPLLGAVGLGSSNDFHKPFRAGADIDGIRVRLSACRARVADVIRIDYESGDGGAGIGDSGPGSGSATRYAILNASIGLTAEANARFNRGGGLVGALRALSVDAAIVAAVLDTLMTFRDIPAALVVDGEEVGDFRISNLGVIKSPHFAGSFCYDTDIESDDGRLGINLCERLSPFAALAMLSALRKGRFSGRPKTRTWTAVTATVEAERSFALETDGETVRARRARFTVVPRAIRCLSPGLPESDQ